MHLKDVNTLDSQMFTKLFENVVEHCPEVVLCLLKSRPYSEISEITTIVNNFLDGLNLEKKRLILEMHPDLNPNAVIDALTTDSAEEQKSAGLDKLNNDEKLKLAELSEEYKTKFGFPFVICVREHRIQSILNAVHIRTSNTYNAELINGIEEVKKISKLRIMQIVTDN